MAALVLDTGDHVGREVDDALEVLGRQVEQVAQTWARPSKYQMCVTGAASSMWPMRSRRTLERVISPQRSQMMPLNRTRLYLPQWHSQSRVGPKMRSQNRPSFSGFRVR